MKPAAEPEEYLPRNAGFIVGAVITCFFAAVAVTAQFWTPYDPSALSIIDKLQPPSLHHWFGTDQLGRDVLSMIMAGAKNSVGVALLSVVIGVFIGVPLGLLAAAPREGPSMKSSCAAMIWYLRSPRCCSPFLSRRYSAPEPSTPSSPSAYSIFRYLRASPAAERCSYGLATTPWLRGSPARSPPRISFEHILPNLVGLLAVQGTIQFSLGVIAEAGLSYVGLGAQPPTPSWGRMLNEAQTLTALAPSLALFPGIAVVLFVLGLNLLGDGLRRRRERMP